MWSAITRLLEEQQPDLEGISYYHQCHGGEVNQSWQLICGDKHFFIKSNHRAMLPRFIEEADQLALLARTGCVKVPRVYGTGTSRHHSFLILEYLPRPPCPQTQHLCLAGSLHSYISGMSNQNLVSILITL